MITKNLYTMRNTLLRSQFEKIASEYESYRFTYPKQLFDTIFSYITNGTTALEIGIGTGKATYPFLESGFNIVAIDPINSMIEIAEKKYHNQSISFINTSFEDFATHDTFDLIYAASSFHWINDNCKLHKIYRLLNNHGVFSRFKTLNIIDDISITNTKLINIYKDHIPDFLPIAPNHHISNTNYIKEGFTDISQFDFFTHHSLDVNTYINMINTYTEYITLNPLLKQSFESSLRANLHNDTIIVTQYCSLHLARK